jgi:hypothetical protein
MYRFTVLVHKLTKELYTDDFLYEATKDDEVRYPDVDKCTSEYAKRLVFIRNQTKRLQTAERIKDAALENQYIQFPQRKGRMYVDLLQVHGKKGENFIDVVPNGFLRELIAKEWKYITLLFLIVGWIAGYLTAT